MFRRTSRFALCIAATFLSTRAFCAADPAAVAKQVDQDVKALAAPSPEARLGAEVRLYSYGPESFPAMEAALQRKDLTPEQSAKLQEIVERIRPWNGARNRAARQLEASHRWNTTTALAAYDAAGNKDPKWEADAREAITLFSTPDKQRSRATRDAVERAVQAGCDDPLILYLRARCSELSGADYSKASPLYAAAADAMTASQYPAFRKFMAYLRCANCFQQDGLRNLHAGQPFSREDARMSYTHSRAAMMLWPDVVKTPDIPVGELVDPMKFLISITSTEGSEGHRPDRKPLFDPLFASLDQVFPNNSTVLMLKGDFYTSYAWDARGGRWAKDVTAPEWKLFHERLDKAEELLTQAWKMNPNDPAAATKMITVERGQGKGREVMETWFQRAMKANPDNNVACQEKLIYLQPKWFGTPEDMIAFGHECRDAMNWHAQLPFLLIDAHQQLAKMMADPQAYYHQPEVWEDIDSVYRQFFAAWPNEPYTRSRYAYYASLCGQWGIAREQFQRLGDKADPNAFDNATQMDQFRKAALSGGL
jgi:hypothetical protein